MREIKFRAWDNKHKKWMWPYPDAFWIIGETTVFNLLAQAEDMSIRDYNEIQIVQYTGLKDKNGTEIYEGDIINDPEWWWGPGEVFLNRGVCGPCIGDSVMAYVCRNARGVSYNIWDGKDVEVIGDIYKNPELREES